MITGTKEEIRKLLKSDLHIEDNKDSYEELKNGCRYFLDKSSFDMQVPDGFSGNLMLFYVEAVEYGQSDVNNMRKRIGCSVNRVGISVI